MESFTLPFCADCDFGRRVCDCTVDEERRGVRLRLFKGEISSVSFFGNAFVSLQCAEGNMNTAPMFKALMNGPTRIIPQESQCVAVRCGALIFLVLSVISFHRRQSHCGADEERSRANVR